MPVKIVWQATAHVLDMFQLMEIAVYERSCRVPREDDRQTEVPRPIKSPLPDAATLIDAMKL